MKFTLAAVAAAALVAPARADLVRFTFQGTFDAITGPLPPPVAVGQPFTFTYVFDTTTPDLEPSPNFGLYGGAIVDARVTTTGFDWTAPSGDIAVLNNGFAGDSYDANAFDADTLAGAGLNDFQFNAFQSDALPDDLPFADFDLRRFFLRRTVGKEFWEIQGEITGFQREVLCYPDCNGDGVLNLADFGCFQTRFALADPRADCNGDGVLNLADFGCFQTRFALGCP